MVNGKSRRMQIRKKLILITDVQVVHHTIQFSENKTGTRIIANVTRIIREYLRLIGVYSRDFPGP